MLIALALTLLALASVTLSDNAPEQVHLAFAGKSTDGYPTGFRVTWYTQDEVETPLVQFGTVESGNLNYTSQGKSSSYLADHGYHHVAEMTGLMPETQYAYRVGSDSSDWSEIFTARSPSTTSDKSFSVSVFGDMGYLGSEERPMIVATAGLVKNWTAVPTRKTLEKLKDSKSIDFIWHVGDIGYMDDAYAHHPVSFTYEKVYNEYMNWLQNLTSVMPYMVSVGNHESECHSPACITDEKYGQALRNFTAYNHRWQMPAPESDGVLAMWYSFNYGPVHFISLNTETDFPGAGEENTGDSNDPLMPAGHFAPNGTYLNWLEQDLAKAASERTTRPWIIAGGHRPFHELNATLGAMFKKYQVDVYFAGHTHSYSRTMPVDTVTGTLDSQNKNPALINNANGTVLIVAGGPGCDEMKFIGTDTTQAIEDTFATPIYATSLLSSGVLHVHNKSTISFDLLSSVDGTVLDNVWVTKDL